MPKKHTYQKGLRENPDLRGAKLLLDTNIIVDYLGGRDFQPESTRLLMVAGKVREFQLWVSATQITDLVYILSNGGKKALLPQVAAAIDGLLDFVSVFAHSKDEVREALRLGWDDPEDAFVYQAALKLEAAAIITRNEKDFEESLVPVYNCDNFFKELKTLGLDYGFVDI